MKRLLILIITLSSRTSYCREPMVTAQNIQQSVTTLSKELLETLQPVYPMDHLNSTNSIVSLEELLINTIITKHGQTFWQQLWDTIRTSPKYVNTIPSRYFIRIPLFIEAYKTGKIPKL